MPQPRIDTWEKTAAKTIGKRTRRESAGEESTHTAHDGVVKSFTPSEVNTSPPKAAAPGRKPYIPRAKSGPFALLIGLAAHGSGVWVTKDDIVARGNPFFRDGNDSLLDEDQGGRRGALPYSYSGWSSVGLRSRDESFGVATDIPADLQMNQTLLKHGYVERDGRKPVRWRITRTGTF